MDSKFKFAVATNKSKGDVTTTPELTVTVSKDKIRINSALSRKLLLQHGDRLMFITNEAALMDAVVAGELTQEEVQENLVFAIAKSIPIVDANGLVQKSVRRLSKAEKEAFEAGNLDCETDEEGKPIETSFYGFKLAALKAQAGYGVILEGSDASHWPMLGGNDQTHKVYGLDEETVEVEIGDQTVVAYPLSTPRDEAKLERKASTKSTDEKDENVEIN